jgi:hypothetical protein
MLENDSNGNRGAWRLNSNVRTCRYPRNKLNVRSMNTDDRLRREEPIGDVWLSVVAWSFLLLGVSAVACTCLHFARGDWMIHTEVLGVIFFFGLRRRSSIVRKLALLTIVFWMLLLPFAAMNACIEIPLDRLTVRHGEGPYTRPFEGTPITVRLFGLSQTHLKDTKLEKLNGVNGGAIGWALGFFALFLFQIWMLTRPQIRRLFYPRGRSFVPPRLPARSNM